jgi:uncharacterized protein YbjT (DUF2867 family)
MSMNFLVTGATGNIGSRVVERLLAQGERPRVFVRDAEKARARHAGRVDIAVGDLGDLASLARALTDVEVLFLVNSGPDLEVRDESAAKVAKAAGVRRLVKLSSMDVAQQVGTGVWHARGEAAIRAEGIPFTFVQPGGFMDNALHWARSVRAEGVVRSSTGDGKIAFIHSDDIADVATAALTTSRYEGRSLPLSGPRALSYPEMTSMIGVRIDKPLRYERISDEEQRRRHAAIGEASAVVQAHVSIFRAIREGRLGGVTDVVEQVLGRKPFAFETWIDRHAAAFA